MTAQDVIDELREFASIERAQWQLHRDRQTWLSGPYEAYNGRVWWINHLQSKLSTIARKEARHRKRKERRNEMAQEITGAL